MPHSFTIDWNHPPPRTGWRGGLDRFIGPGATNAELWLQFLPTAAATIAAPIYAASIDVGWHWTLYFLCAVFALDLVGGIATNATSSAKRWYHRPGQGFAQHFRFVLMHLLHPVLIAWLFRGGDWWFAFAVGGYLVLAAAAILLTPLYLQRTVALLLLTLALVIEPHLFDPTPGMEWFVPAFFVKVLVSHLLREEPYRPMHEHDRHAVASPPAPSPPDTSH